MVSSSSIKRPTPVSSTPCWLLTGCSDPEANCSSHTSGVKDSLAGGGPSPSPSMALGGPLPSVQTRLEQRSTERDVSDHSEKNSVFPSSAQRSRRSQPGSELRNDRLDSCRFRWLSECPLYQTPSPSTV
ncbi:unnamed protein product [Boreogadus saida]